MEQGRLGIGVVLRKVLFFMALHLRDGKREHGLRAGSSAQGAQGAVSWLSFNCKYFLVVFPRRERQNGVASGWMSAPKRGGGLERFGSVLEADGLPLAGDSWLLHQKKNGVFKGIGLALKPKELLTYWLSYEALEKQSYCGFFCWWQMQKTSVSVRVWLAKERRF